MKTLLSGAQAFTGGALKRKDVAVEGGKIVPLAPTASRKDFDSVLDFSHLVLLPGLVDVHVHLREPGFCYKETIASGARAAARGGFTAVCAMPNLMPPPDTPEHLKMERDAIEKDACVNVYPYGTITIGQAGKELVDFAAMKNHVIAFSDDGKGVQNDDLMREAMKRVKAIGGLIAAHCEDEMYLNGGYIHDGDYACLHGHAGISSKSEWRMIERDIALVRETGCRYHVCHVSAKESVQLIRAAKKEGLPITCETAPHYLILCDEQLEEHGRFKMNPPIRAAADRDALIEGVLDGTIDVIATDHAPHSAEEKSKGLQGSVMGVVGLETSFAAMYTAFVKKDIMTLEMLIERMSLAPRRIFGLGGGIEPGQKADLTAFDLSKEFVVNPDTFLSMGKATPFEGMQLTGECVFTMVGGKIVWS